MRIILFTGKGGVGKSTNACATAALASEMGRKTLLVSSDLAHNLTDILNIPNASGRVKLSELLTVLEVDILHEIKENWDSIQRYMVDLFSYLEMDSVIAEEIALIPGLDALFLLTRILREVESGEYDLVVIDCPPTAGTLPLLTLTDSSSNKLNRIVRIERNILKLIRPFGKRLESVKQMIPEDEIYVTFGKIMEDIGRLGGMLRDPETSSVRLVLNPDKIAVAETKRTYTYLSLFGFPVDGILVNKLLPLEVKDGYFNTWRRLQRDQMEQLQKSFLDTRIIPIKHYDKEPIGLACLEEMGKEIYGALDPVAVLSRVNTVAFTKRKGKVVLSIMLPGLDKASLDIGRKDNELLINAAAYSRIFRLPDTLAKTSIEAANYENSRLSITFSAENEPVTG